jgi:hypothetical protein
MDQEPESPFDLPADDPELAALLRFEPVPRKQSRAGGWWSPENQRLFIRVLAETGDYRLAAEAVGLSANSAYQLRKEAGSDDFRRAWEEAVALHRRRHRPAAFASNRHARRAQDARARRGAWSGQADEPELEEAEREKLLDEIMKRYIVKLKAERRARLEGRIVEADDYVRQLTCIELILDIGGRTQLLLDNLRLGDLHLLKVSATPGSALLEKARRAVWLEKEELDRPPPAPLGRHNGLFATGRDDYDPARDGDRKDWERKQAERRRLAAEAQREWEERAKGEAEARASRQGDAGPAEGDPEPPGGLA